MARVNGPLDFTGSLSHLTFYRRKDSKKLFVKEKSGPTKQQIDTDPRFALTKKNTYEWDGCVKGLKWLHRMLHPLKAASDYNYTGDLTGQLKPVQLMDTSGVYGQRSVWLSRYPRLLEGFSISRQTPFDALLRTPLGCHMDKENLRAEVHLPEIIAGVNFRPRTLHPFFRVVASLGIVPDLHHTPYGYTPDVPAGSYLPQVAETAWTTVKKGLPETALELELPYRVEYPSFLLVLAVAIHFGTPDALGQIKAVPYTGSGRIAAAL